MSPANIEALRFIRKLGPGFITAGSAGITVNAGLIDVWFKALRVPWSKRETILRKVNIFVGLTMEHIKSGRNGNG